MSNTMTHKRLVNAFIKAGCTVENVPRWSGEGPSNHWKATNPKTGNWVDWYTQDAFVPSKGEIEAHYDPKNQITTHVTWHSPQTDLWTDCHCDSFRHTIKSSVALIA